MRLKILIWAGSQDVKSLKALKEYEAKTPEEKLRAMGCQIFTEVTEPVNAVILDTLSCEGKAQYTYRNYYEDFVGPVPENDIVSSYNKLQNYRTTKALDCISKQDRDKKLNPVSLTKGEQEIFDRALLKSVKILPRPPQRNPELTDAEVMRLAGDIQTIYEKILDHRKKEEFHRKTADELVCKEMELSNMVFTNGSLSLEDVLKDLKNICHKMR